MINYHKTPNGFLIPKKSEDFLRINKLKDIVKKGLDHEGSGHDFKQTMKVYNNAMKIAEGENVDLDVIKTSVLFHDYAYSEKFFEGEHGDISAKLAKPIIEKENFAKEQVRKILLSIEKHNFWQHNESDVPIETKILRDADRLDAIGYTGILRAISYAINAKKNPIQSLKDQLTISFETKKGIELSNERFRVIREFIQNIESEFN